MSEDAALIGSWSLDSFELRSTDGTISYPYGENLTGYLFYNADGFMSAAFMNAERGQKGDGDLSEAGRTNTYDHFMAYTGPFEARGDKITHYVEVSSLEVWIGTVQERWYKIDGDRLELLTAPLTVGSDAPVGRLTWNRVSRPAQTS
jgi:Lipocalin-like domain